MIDRLAFVLLWLATFSLPWEDIVALPGLDPSEGVRVSRLFGLAAFAAALVAIATTGRLRVPGRFHAWGGLFLLWAASSVLWSIDPETTVERVTTYGQLVLLAALLWQLARTEQRQLALFQGYVLGAYVSAGDTLRNFLAGDATMSFRYVSGNFNPNDLGFTLVLALPMAWYLSVLRPRGAPFWLNRLYLPVGMAAILLTASRGAFIPSIVALTLVPWTLPRLRWRSRAAVVVLMAVTVVALGTVVPSSSWSRLAETRSEITEGTLTHRRDIWRAGMLVVASHPVTGVGAGTFNQAAAPHLDRARASHNTYLSVLVEQGLVGLAIFVALFLAAMLPIRTMPSLQRKFWIVLSCTLIIGLLPRNWDYRKATWFVLASLASQGAMVAYARRGTAPGAARVPPRPVRGPPPARIPYPATGRTAPPRGPATTRAGPLNEETHDRDRRQHV